MRLISSLFSLSLLTLVVAQDYQHVLHPGRRMPSLADLLTVDRRASLFYDYARDDSALNERLSSFVTETCLMVPINSVIMAAPRKPHQLSDVTQDKADTMSVQELDAAYSSTIEKWLASHTIPNTFNYASITAVTLDTLRPGHSVTLEPKDGQWTIQPGNLAVLELHQARNGVLLILDGMIDVD